MRRSRPHQYPGLRGTRQDAVDFSFARLLRRLRCLPLNTLHVQKIPRRIPDTEQPCLHRRSGAQGPGYAGEHQRLIDQKTWDRVHSILQESPRLRANNTRAKTPALLKALLYGEDGAAFSPTHTRKGDRLYRYYVSQTVLKHGAGRCPVPRVPAAEIEAAVIDQLRAMLRAPEVVVATWKAAQLEPASVTENEVREALTNLDPLWAQLFPAEQARDIQLLIEWVEIGTVGLKIRFRDKGLAEMVTEVGTVAAKSRKAAA